MAGGAEQSKPQLVQTVAPEGFLAAADAAVKAGKEVWALFTAARKETGERWCPDCRDAEPVIYGAFAGKDADKCVLVEVECVREPYKKDDFFLRTDTKVALTAIPTLVRFTAEGAVGERLVEDAAKDAGNVGKLVGASQ